MGGRGPRVFAGRRSQVLHVADGQIVGRSWSWLVTE